MPIDLNKYKLATTTGPDLSSYKINSTPPDTRSLSSKIWSGLATVGKALTTSERGFGESIAGAILPHTATGRSMEESQKKVTDSSNNFITTVTNRIREKKAKGQDITRELDQLKNAGVNTGIDSKELNPALAKTNKQVIGEALGTAVDVLSFGTYGAAAKGAQTGKLLSAGQKVVTPIVAKSTTQAVKQGAIRGAVKAAPIGAGFGAASAMQENEDLGGILSRTFSGAATSAVVGGVFEGVASRKQINPEVLRKQALDQYKKGLMVTKEKYKEKADKIIPDLLDAELWGSKKHLLEQADEGMKLASDEYAKLGELKGISDTGGIIDTINKEIAKLGHQTIDENGDTVYRALSTNKAKVKTLMNLRDDILSIQQYDELGRGVTAQEELRKLAQQYGDELYDTRRAQKTIADNKVLSQLKKVDSAIRDMLNSDPRNIKYKTINRANHVTSELYDIIKETEQRQSGHKFFGLQRVLEATMGGLGVTVGAASGGPVGGVAGLLGSLSVAGIVEIANSTWWNTMRAVQKNQLAQKLLQEGLQDRTEVIRMIANNGIKAVNAYLNEGRTNDDEEISPSELKLEDQI